MIEKRRDDGKPPYRVPPMAEIRAVPQNGLTLVSTFSGCGGSCLGFRMAGFRTLWASEFISSACEVYKLNHPGIRVDIRDVKPEEILRAVGMEKGEIDVLEGSPPCASFSTAGKREKKWGQVVKYSETKQRVDDLFFEFVRILDGLQPRAFVAENVSGLVKGKAKGYFKEVLAAMKAAGYRVSARLLDAQWLGVPQSRQRVIFVGMRADLKAEPTHPLPLGYRYSVAEAIPWVIKQQHVIDCTDRPAPCVRQAGTGQLYVETKNGIDLQKVEPETDISRFAIGREWDKLAPGEQSEKYFSLRKAHPDEPSPCVTQSAGTAWSPAAAAGVTHPTERRKFSIAELRRICAFPDDFKLTGSYSQQWERLGRAVPPVMAFWIARSVREVLFGLDGRDPWPHDPPCLVAGLDYERG